MKHAILSAVMELINVSWQIIKMLFKRSKTLVDLTAFKNVLFHAQDVCVSVFVCAYVFELLHVAISGHLSLCALVHCAPTLFSQYVFFSFWRQTLRHVKLCEQTVHDRQYLPIETSWAFMALYCKSAELASKMFVSFPRYNSSRFVE